MGEISMPLLRSVNEPGYRDSVPVAVADICPSVSQSMLVRKTTMLHALEKPGAPRPVAVLLAMTSIVPSCTTAMEE